MIKKLTKTEVALYFSLIENANLYKGDYDGKIALTDLVLALEPEGAAYKKFESTVRKKMEGENHQEMVSKAERYENLSPAERKEINDYFTLYNKKVNEYLEEEATKIVEVEINKWTLEQFKTLTGCNNYNVPQVLALKQLLLSNFEETADTAKDTEE